LDPNIPAFEYEIPAGIEDKLSEASDPVKATLGTNADMWSGDNRMR
jgi:hypothetical protein